MPFHPDEPATSRLRLRAAPLATAAVTGLLVLVPGPGLAATPARAPGPLVVQVGDVLTVLGTAGRDHVTVRTVGSQDLALDLDGDGVDDRVVPLDGVASLRADLGGGGDRFAVDDASAPLPSHLQVVLDGGRGADTLRGGVGPETVLGGDGPERVTGGGAADTLRAGDGNDVVLWSDGDGDDVVDGGGGDDTVTAGGSAAAERFELSTVDGALVVGRDLGAVALDVRGTEHVEVLPHEGRDTVLVRDLSGTGVEEVSLDLAATLDAGTVSGVDFVAGFGTEEADVMSVAGAGGAITVSGPAAGLAVTAGESSDALGLSGFGGDDRIDARRLAADSLGFGAFGGSGHDELVGGASADSLDGGTGDDTLTGGPDADSVFAGDGDDRLRWVPGDGSDRVSGEGGRDTLLFRGSAADEAFALEADGFGGAVLRRDLDDTEVALDRVEVVDLPTAAGSDLLAVGDLSDFRGTGVAEVLVDLGPGRRTADRVTVAGSPDDDGVEVAGSRSFARVSGLPATVTVTSPGVGDALRVDGLDGDDRIVATGLRLGPLRLVLDGGGGSDLLVGRPGDLLLNGELVADE